MTRNEFRQLIREVIQELEIDSRIDTINDPSDNPMLGKFSGGSPHSRYAQQAGATPFDAPGDQAIN
jgi:predicted Zn-dependent protease with MMP-like domain